jgi:uncharacterized protein
MTDDAETPRIPEPALSAEEEQAFARGVAQFNRALFFECHDTLEDLWSGVRGAPRDFFQGLIQVAVAFHHLERGNPRGAASVFAKALARLERYPPRYAGLELEALRSTVRDWATAVASGAERPGGRAAPRMKRP